MRPSEDELIAKYFSPLAGPGAFGLTDDAAILAQAPGEDTVVSSDMLTAGVHFFADDPPDFIARKALRVNLSDLAAKGAVPRGFLLSLALPEEWNSAWLGQFARGLGEDAAMFGCPLLGGDTVKILGPLTISIMVLGAVPRGQIISRQGVAEGDLLYVTGTIGDAALGLILRREAERPSDGLGGQLGIEDVAYLTNRYLLPQPRLEMRWALGACAHAAMDISDGLAGDLAKILKLNGVTTVVQETAIPLSSAARRLLNLSPRLFEAAVTGGDDYELLCSVPEPRGPAFEAAAREVGLVVTAIGTVKAGQAPPRFVDETGKNLTFRRLSFQHF
ncbi:MAG TPA: thiamine-phosphate kinase [Methylocella sp.]|nr:thiamine-phosphate kinase [Methylocella sp.]